MIKARKLTTFFDKTKGLMFTDKIIPTYLETRYGVHTYFLKQPIDIVVMDQKNTVRVLKEQIKPWRIFLWNPSYFRVLELPPGFTQKTNIKKGDTLKVEFLK